MGNPGVYTDVESQKLQTHELTECWKVEYMLANAPQVLHWGGASGECGMDPRAVERGLKRNPVGRSVLLKCGRC